MHACGGSVCLVPSVWCVAFDVPVCLVLLSFLFSVFVLVVFPFLSFFLSLALSLSLSLSLSSSLCLSQWKAKHIERK